MTVITHDQVQASWCCCSFPHCVFCVLDVGDCVCAGESDERSPPVELDLSGTSGMYLAVGPNPLKKWTDDKWMEQHSDTSRLEAKQLYPCAINYNIREKH